MKFHWPTVKMLKVFFEIVNHICLNKLILFENALGLGSVEVAVLTMACLVFLGAFIAVLCICCIKMKR